MWDLTSPSRDGTGQKKMVFRQLEFSREVWTGDILFGVGGIIEMWKSNIWSKTDLPSRETVTMGERSRTIFWEITMAKEMEERSEKQETCKENKKSTGKFYNKKSWAIVLNKVNCDASYKVSTEFAVRQFKNHLSEVSFSGVVGQKPDDISWKAGGEAGQRWI